MLTFYTFIFKFGAVRYEDVCLHIYIERESASVSHTQTHTRSLSVQHSNSVISHVICLGSKPNSIYFNTETNGGRVSLDRGRNEDDTNSLCTTWKYLFSDRHLNVIWMEHRCVRNINLRYPKKIPYGRLGDFRWGKKLQGFISFSHYHTHRRISLERLSLTACSLHQPEGEGSCDPCALHKAEGVLSLTTRKKTAHNAGTV